MTRRDRLHFAMPRPVPPGLWRRVPPAIFPPVLGALGLALAWLAGVNAFALPPALAQLLAGMALALAAFGLLAYAGKLARRPAVLTDELSILPGRAGVAAGVLSIYLTAALLGAIGGAGEAAGGWHGAGRVLLVAGLACHAVFLVALIGVLRAGPAEQRRVTPVWHLSFTGIIVAARAALVLGWPGLAAALWWPSALSALAILALSLAQLVAARPPAPLRPLLAIHLAPLALLATVALGLGWGAAGAALAWAALALLMVLAAAGPWLLAGGFSPLWGALTFPVAATAGAWVTLWHAQPSEPHRLVAGVLLVAATLVVIPVLALVWRDWARGRLGVKTNAAIA